VLEALGFARAAPTLGSSRALTRNAVSAVKRRAPGVLKRLYGEQVPLATRHRWAAPTMMAPLDWSRTRAFALNSDQHGWVRINLVGRESAGIVPMSEYRRTCDELAAVFSGLCTTDGRSVVREVVRGAANGAPHELLPDLVVHWTDAAFDRPLRLRDPAVTVTALVPAKTGQHRPEGFCLARGLDLPSMVEASELGGALAAAAG
jgi:predicted AlkP superfamily phosphohydrolase/phosphomutase